ncbi:hypothetical protein ON010_g6250 [Phytophthora cinnamomi]|nr:hypothetical protein ON010_g6250 [Phytophthora cinnamomi]
MKVSCGHVMANRKSYGASLDIPFSAISPQYVQVLTMFCPDIVHVFSFIPGFDQASAMIAHVGGSAKADYLQRSCPSRLTETEKNRRAQQSFGRISGELKTALSELDKWWHNLRKEKVILEEPASGDKCDEARSKLSGEPVMSLSTTQYMSHARPLMDGGSRWLQ